MDRKPGTLFYLVGHAGVGKYTIAKEIAALTEARIVDNHYINNPIFGLIELYRAEPLPDEVWDRVVRSAILETIVTLSPPSWSFIFTQVATDAPAELAIYQQILATAERRGSCFLPVRLVCDTDELCRRIMSPDRRKRLKDTSPENARRDSVAPVLDTGHRNTMTLDVTRLRPREVAARIVARAQSLRA